MRIPEVLCGKKTAFSFEFFPPRTKESAARLFDAVARLAPLRPAFVSVTYGAGGSTRELTRELVLRIRRETSLEVVSHLTCVGATRDEISRIVEELYASGIRNIMALRGDPPHGERDFAVVPGGFRYAAELVAFLRSSFADLIIGVAGFVEGHPEARNRLVEMDHLRAKVDAGADYICTQLFFDNRDFFDFSERAKLAGIRVPIVAGIMPITTRRGMERMAGYAPRARFPAALLRALGEAHHDEQVERVGISWAKEQVRELAERGVCGVHFYTLNSARATLEICEALGVA